MQPLPIMPNVHMVHGWQTVPFGRTVTVVDEDVDEAVNERSRK